MLVISVRIFPGSAYRSGAFNRVTGGKRSGGKIESAPIRTRRMGALCPPGCRPMKVRVEMRPAPGSGGAGGVDGDRDGAVAPAALLTEGVDERELAALQVAQAEQLVGRAGDRGDALVGDDDVEEAGVVDALHVLGAEVVQPAAPVAVLLDADLDRGLGEHVVDVAGVAGTDGDADESGVADDRLDDLLAGGDLGLLLVGLRRRSDHGLSGHGRVLCFGLHSLMSAER